MTLDLPSFLLGVGLTALGQFALLLVLDALRRFLRRL